MEPYSPLISLQEYASLSKQDRLKIMEEARQQETYRKPIPIEGLSFPEESWLPLSTEEMEWSWFQRKVNRIALRTYRYPTKNQPRGVVALFHGMTSHINQGAYVGKRLSEAGFVAVGFDQRGFGKSEGKRGYMDDYSLILEDSLKFVKLVRQKYPGLPLYLCGLSLGGLTCFNLAVANPEMFAGVILMAPAFRSYHGSSALVLAKILSFLRPGLQLPKGGGKRGSKNPAVSETRKSDSYRYQQKPYVVTLKNTLEGMQASEAKFERLVVPVLIIQGMKDNSVDPDAAVELYRKCKSDVKKMLLYRNLWHNIWQEEEIHQIMTETIDFISKIS